MNDIEHPDIERIERTGYNSVEYERWEIENEREEESTED